MAIKRAEIRSDVVDLIEKSAGKETVKLKDEFNAYINDLIVKGLNSSKVSADNQVLLDIIMQTAKRLDKTEYINEKLKGVLKELNFELIKEL
ncbi:hypothetical protein CE91St25_17370 [Campylobacter ureolyticus]|uniref:hypothetical protein n=1 Tax=Campylobacter ureolyticus TaxID=827 RepID=UPI001FC7C0BA|nr:hypothetical protein [Campylobacter ureolyticus]GKH61401.1 hypothetical protein CE91St25_17370 [Campylobacter ureolyticus]